MHNPGNSSHGILPAAFWASGIVGPLFGLFRLWHCRQSTRRQLARLNAWELADIGCDPLLAEREAAKPFWMA